MIKIFSKNRKTLSSDVDTYIVHWTTYKNGCDIRYPTVRECYKAFTDKNEADEYAEAINSSLKLVGITSLPRAIVYLQKTNDV